MSAANGNTASKGGPPAKGEKDDTLVKVTGAAIATGIAYSLYESFFVGKKTEEPYGFDHPHGEPFHEQIGVSKSEELSRLDRAGQFDGGVKDFKESVKEAVLGKSRETKEWAAGTGEKLKEEAEEGKEAAVEKAHKEKENTGGWFSWLGGKAREENDEPAYEAEKAKEVAKKNLEEGKEKAYEAKKSTEDKEKSFFDRAGAELDKDKKELTKAVVEAEKSVERAVVGAEKNVEKAGAAVVGKLTASKDKPKHKHHHASKEYGIRRGDTLWSISRRYGVTIEELKVANGIWNADYIVAGDTLTIPK